MRHKRLSTSIWSNLVRTRRAGSASGQDDEFDKARRRRPDLGERRHKGRRFPKIEGRVRSVRRARRATISDSPHEIGRSRIAVQRRAALLHLDQREVEYGSDGGQRLPLRLGGEGFQRGLDVAWRDRLDRPQVERRADRLQGAGADRLALGVFVRPRRLGEVQVHRALEGQRPGFVSGPLPGLAGAAGVCARVDKAEGLAGLLARLGKTSEGKGTEADAPALAADGDAQNP